MIITTKAQLVAFVKRCENHRNHMTWLTTIQRQIKERVAFDGYPSEIIWQGSIDDITRSNIELNSYLEKPEVTLKFSLKYDYHLFHSNLISLEKYSTIRFRGLITHVGEEDYCNTDSDYVHKCIPFEVDLKEILPVNHKKTSFSLTAATALILFIGSGVIGFFLLRGHPIIGTVLFISALGLGIASASNTPYWHEDKSVMSNFGFCLGVLLTWLF